MGQSLTKATAASHLPSCPWGIPLTNPTVSRSRPTWLWLCRSSLANDGNVQNPREVGEGTNESCPASLALGAESHWEEIGKAGSKEKPGEMGL